MKRPEPTSTELTIEAARLRTVNALNDQLAKFTKADEKRHQAIQEELYNLDKRLENCTFRVAKLNSSFEQFAQQSSAVEALILERLSNLERWETTLIVCVTFQFALLLFVMFLK